MARQKEPVLKKTVTDSTANVDLDWIDFYLLPAYNSRVKDSRKQSKISNKIVHHCHDDFARMIGGNEQIFCNDCITGIPCYECKSEGFTKTCTPEGKVL